MEMHMSINQHHARFLRKKQNDILNKKLEPPTMWVYHWLHSTSSLLNAGIPTDHVFDLAQNLFEPYESNAKNIGNIYIALTTLSAVTSNRSINDLYSIKGFDCKKEINSLLQLLKTKDNTYKMYEHGETDVRSVYCAIAVSEYIGIEIAIPIDFLLSCQSYDGGFSGIPDTESHAGFTYCAVASLAISKELQRCNMIQLIGWLACRAENVNGRISKESDSCYAYWIGATVKILEINGFVNAELRDSIFDSLYAYVMRCEEKWGGFSDKVGGKSDLQHTAYALFFLSLNDKYNSFIYTINPLYGFVERK